MRAVVLGIMKRLKQKPEELGVVELVPLDICFVGSVPLKFLVRPRSTWGQGWKSVYMIQNTKRFTSKPLKALCLCPLVWPLCFWGRWYCRVLSSRPRHWCHAYPVLWALVQSAAGALRSSLRLGLWQVLMVDLITISSMDNIHMPNWAGLQKE